jgi:hypothetical protein
MEPCELRVGDIVQIDPTHDDGRGGQWFGGCLMVVTEPKPWGAQGYVQSAGVATPHYYRCVFANMERTGGMAPWVLQSRTPSGT